MVEYIERETVKDELLSWAVCINHPEHLMREDAMHILDSIPAADVAPVRHERWEIVVGSDGKEHMVCTGCRKQQDLTDVFSYCPNCGAKMDGGDGNNAICSKTT